MRPPPVEIRWVRFAPARRRELGPVAVMAGGCALALAALLIAAAATRGCAPEKAAPVGAELVHQVDELGVRLHRDAELVAFWRGVAFQHDPAAALGRVRVSK